MFLVKTVSVIAGGLVLYAIFSGIAKVDAEVSGITDRCQKTELYAIDSRNHIIEVYDCSARK